MTMIGKAWEDVRDAFGASYLWRTLAWSDIRQRYRRSMLGPLWMTLTMGAMIVGMGPLYASIFKRPIVDFYPYLAVGFIVWGYLASVLSESCLTFIAAEPFIKQVRIPLTHFVLRVVWRNLIVFGHHVLLVIPIFLYVGRDFPAVSWLVPIGLAIIAIASVGMSYGLGIICARFRDMQQIVVAVTQLLFFLTPILWKPDQVLGRTAFIDLNPFYYFIELVRDPLLGVVPPVADYLSALAFAVAAFAIGFGLFARLRDRVAYWM